MFYLFVLPSNKYPKPTRFPFPPSLFSPKGLLIGFLFFLFFYWLVDLSEREIVRERETLICCAIYLCIHWSILVCTLIPERLTENQTHNLGILGRCSTHWATSSCSENKDQMTCQGLDALHELAPTHCTISPPLPKHFLPFQARSCLRTIPRRFLCLELSSPTLRCRLLCLFKIWAWMSPANCCLY